MDDDSDPTMERALGAYLLQRGLPVALRGVPVDALVQLWTDGYRAAGATPVESAPVPRLPDAGRHPPEVVQRAVGDAIRADWERVRDDWHPTSLHLSPDDLGQLDALARRTHYSRSEVIRILLRLGLRLHADGLAPKDFRANARMRLRRLAPQHPPQSA